MMETAPVAGQVKTLRLLLVDDEEDVRNLYRSIFEQAGFAVTAVETARDGARAALDGVFDVAVVDERLPDVRGTALVRWLRRRFRAMPVVLFSAFADWEMFFRASGCGAKDVVAKDVSAREILRVVRHCVGKTEGR
jgi:DNA-binding NtrC family response regulator